MIDAKNVPLDQCKISISLENIRIEIMNGPNIGRYYWLKVKKVRQSGHCISCKK